MSKRLGGIMLVDDGYITNHLNSELIYEMNIAHKGSEQALTNKK